MIKVAIVCGGGFSSSVLARSLEKQITEKHLEDQVNFIFIPMGELVRRQNEVDIALCCPHLRYQLERKVTEYTIPVSVIPPRLYGLVPADAFIEDAEDLLDLWNHGAKNILHFEDESNSVQVTRITSHRKWLAQQAKKQESAA